uniref:Uncharacterized protein n=1 Tax=Panagrolaimus sp. PS1159 TaxID=55785 RepID=A0AC35GHD2_9BILA
MGYCEYFEKQGIHKEGCPIPKSLEPKTTPKPSFQPCTNKFLFDTCQASDADVCVSKQLCVQVTGEPCCAPSPHQCPTIEQLGVKCIC